MTISLVLVIVVLLYVIFHQEQKKNSNYWKARYNGFDACQSMVMSRIKQYYPEKEDELYENLLQ